MAIESVGNKFIIELSLLAQKKTKEAVELVASQVQIGMSEKDGIKLIDSVLISMNCEKCWHPHKFRIGKNTLCSFRGVSDESIKLKENDIYFIDIGPVFEGHEGDFGKTFVVGINAEYELIKDSVANIFIETCDEWRKRKLTGVELYEFANQRTMASGHELNMKMNGHRIGDFPHAIHHKGKLSDTELVPVSGLWVLEILIRHPELEFGAFYEDMIF